MPPVDPLEAASTLSGQIACGRCLGAPTEASALERKSGAMPSGEGRGQGSSAMRLSDENLRGRTVIGADGQAVGEVAALFLDSEAWSVESLRVKLRKEIADQLGASRTMFHAGTVEIPIRLIQSVGDAVVLSVPVDGLREVLPGGGEPASAH